MLNTDFSQWPSFTEEEADKVCAVLLSNKVNYWTGQEGREFEKEFAQFADCQYAVAVANGTLALDLALVALSVGRSNGGGENDEVIVTSRTFLASVSSVVTAGAKPIFADVDVNSQNITADTISSVITENTKAIVCVHLAGMPCEMSEIMHLANAHNIKVIEDCAQAHGAKYKGKPVGSIGHIGCWSFCQDKIMTTGGEGGMVTTNDRELWSKMWSYKDHGKSWESIYEREHAPGFRWLHDSFGTNWRMTEMQAAIGRIQLKRMQDWTAKRVENSNRIWETAENLPGLSVPIVPEYIDHAGYKAYVFVDVDALNVDWNRDRIMEEITRQGVPCYSGSCSEVYLEHAFDNTVFRPEKRLPNAQELGETSLMFLVHPTLTVEEIDKTCRVIISVLNKAQK
ncbi:DegT/DnrJ/EryC1/StrS aminotransferase family protein [Oceanospirillaceae bacterium]|nr:DegT/DnrJ/EryC1/StrS aminotransferase family protein [Oceanospirillaceae bacterium]